MRRMVLIAVGFALLCLPGVAVANDVADFAQSPGSEAVGFAEAVGQDIFDFLSDIFDAPDGIGFGVINGGEAGALFFAFDENWVAKTGMDKIPLIAGAASLGLTVSVEGEQTSNVQPIAGLAVTLTNIKGGQLQIGATLCSSDLSDDYLDCGPLRAHYAPKIEYRMPLQGGE